jgi:hypothetical protein
MKSVKNFATIFIITLLTLAGCKTPQKLYESGDYDGTIRLVAEKMRKKKIDEDDIKTLVQAFNHINTLESDKLTRLRAEQRTDEKWTEVYRIANKIRERQDLIKPFMAYDDEKYFGHLQDLKFTNVDYAILESRDGSAEFYYKKANDNLERARKGDRVQARAAYDDFIKVGEYYSTYKETATLKDEAYRLGINHAFFKIENDSRAILPADFEAQVKGVFVRDLNTKWVKYHTIKDQNLRYEYDIVNRITSIDISPERNDNNQWIEEADVEDGFDYQYDEGGKVKKDTLGNEMKTKKFVKVRASIYEVRQIKEARVFGFLEYYDNRTREKVLNQPLETKGGFQNVAVRYEGDKRALKKETLRRIGGNPKPFPSDGELLMLVTEDMKNRTKTIMNSNSYLLER